ncbi:hypothetical protein [Streptomyces sp. CB01881]|uniref:hypothetical protein n=1 Tax=Streptomyces sp. CB01881 TaxID=2078691 RepID=UPI001F11A722|nr:hypothetical protein [Streptomyces sp. CB01881]
MATILAVAQQRGTGAKKKQSCLLVFLAPPAPHHPHVWLEAVVGGWKRQLAGMPPGRHRFRQWSTRGLSKRQSWLADSSVVANSGLWVGVLRATHEVRLDGPAEVSAAAEQVRQMARRVQPLLKALIGDASPGRRREYDAAYLEFREAFVAFIGLARQALEVKDQER